jgi:hypothetical protein
MGHIYAVAPRTVEELVERLQATVATVDTILLRML